jgi:hypothetical protein
MQSRKLDQEPQITAQPKSVADARMSSRIAEPGLSVEPEELGRHFLSEATEQANFESMMDDDSTEMYINAPAPTDDPLTSPVWAENRSIWQQTVERSLQGGAFEDVMFEPTLAGNEQVQGADHGFEDDDDVVASSIREVSLFDREGRRPGEVVAPDIETDEQAAQTRRREAARFSDSGGARRTSARPVRSSRRAVSSGRR